MAAQRSSSAAIGSDDERPATNDLVIRGVPGRLILMKGSAAGRIPRGEGLPFRAENAKSDDLISIVFGTEQEAAESTEFARNCSSRSPADPSSPQEAEPLRRRPLE